MAFALKYPNLPEAGQFSSLRIKILTLQAFREHKQAADNDRKIQKYYRTCVNIDATERGCSVS